MVVFSIDCPIRPFYPCTTLLNLWDIISTRCAKKKDILNIHVKSEGINIFSQKLG